MTSAGAIYGGSDNNERKHADTNSAFAHTPPLVLGLKHACSCDVFRSAEKNAACPFVERLCESSGGRKNSWLCPVFGQILSLAVCYAFYRQWMLYGFCYLINAMCKVLCERKGS